ncbi:Telomerase protein component 1 [Cytospora paraplurivora]|uniref:phosphatidylinositol-3,4,5-trisphosphate 3-phosphatase n=1 Tax=Cytospora paraplurivora TaxID=2898453 RepID=A0AAN9U8N7_9PEZI
MDELIPMITASMRNWLEGGDDTHSGERIDKDTSTQEAHGGNKNGRVVVIHCKAGKGRSGTATCSYLISQRGWKAEDALARFTERRMRPKFGAGVSIPSQLRWINYVDRWTKGGKKYVDREIEVVEVHVWGLRHGVKITVEGFADEGKKIKVLHTFKREERVVVQGDAPGSGGMLNFLGDAISPSSDEEEIFEDADYGEIVDGDKKGSGTSSPIRKEAKKNSRSSLIPGGPSELATPSSTSSATNISAPNPNASQPSRSNTSTVADKNEPGGMAVILKPTTPVRVPNSDVNISFERRNRAPAYLGFTMVTAIAHVWFNAFFEGNGPEQDGKADESGIFEIEWDKLDGLKGSSRKGTRAADRISVVWRAVGTPGPVPVVNEPGLGSPVPQMHPADWKGVTDDDPGAHRALGLRAEYSSSEGVSKASSIVSQEVGIRGGAVGAADEKGSDNGSLKGVRSSDPSGEDLQHHSITDHEQKIEATKGRTGNPDEASGSSASEEQLLKAATAPVREARAGKPSETAIKQKEAEEEAKKIEGSEADKSVEDQEGHNEDHAHHKSGLVKIGKKLVPTHHDDTGDDGKDPRLVHASVKK